MTAGPGRLVLVVGPSGAGKDTIIRAARERLRDDPRVAFPRRIVTRPPSDAEDNVAVDEAAFDAMEAGGELAFAWRAHGLGYGLPRAVEADLADGRAVACNVSRTVVPALRERYGRVLVVEVTAPPDVLRARLLGRARAEDGPVEARLARSSELGRLEPDLVICNDGPIERASDQLVQALTGP